MSLKLLLEALDKATKNVGYRPFEDLENRLMKLISDLKEMTETDSPIYIALVTRNLKAVIDETCKYVSDKIQEENERKFVKRMCELVRNLAEAISFSQLKRIGYKIAFENCVKIFSEFLLDSKEKT